MVPYKIGRTTNGIINSIVMYLTVVNSQLRKLLSLLGIRIQLALSIVSTSARTSKQIIEGLKFYNTRQYWNNDRGSYIEEEFSKRNNDNIIII